MLFVRPRQRVVGACYAQKLAENDMHMKSRTMLVYGLVVTLSACSFSVQRTKLKNAHSDPGPRRILIFLRGAEQHGYVP
jgi:hypothetical protein